MQIIFSTFVVFQLFTACVSVRPKDVPGTRIFGSLSRQTLFPDASLQSCAGYSGSLCASDCRTLMICAGKAESIANITCPEYCSVNECSTQLPSACQSDSNFVCTSKGTFPDPNDCTKYHYCLYTGATSIDYQCQPEFAFNLQTKTCTFQAPCQTVNCASSENQWMQYDNANTGYYVYCGSPPLMFKCADADNYNFNVGTNSCVFDCPRNGSFVDVFDCTQYLSCNYISSNVYTVVAISCPPNSYFNGVECALGTCTSQMQSSSPELLGAGSEQ